MVGFGNRKWGHYKFRIRGASRRRQEALGLMLVIGHHKRKNGAWSFIIIFSQDSAMARHTRFGRVLAEL